MIYDTIENTYLLKNQKDFEIASKQITNGTLAGDHIGVGQEYLVHTFFWVAQNKTGSPTGKDVGNDHILYTSQGRSTGSFGGQRSDHLYLRELEI